MKSDEILQDGLRERAKEQHRQIRIIGYKFFNNTEEFEQWQRDNPQFIVNFVSPAPTGFVTTDEEGNDVDMKPYEVFVTYTYPKE